MLEDAQKTGQADNTLVIFFSDNGAYPIAASNAPFRGYASELFEGGIHIACIARWPGKLPVGVVDARPTMTFDLSASILAAAGVTPPVTAAGRHGRPRPDRRGKPPQPRTLFWRARRAERTWKAVRDGDVKYLSRQDGDELDEYLFDLSNDPDESDNLINQRPEIAQLLKEQLAEWEQEVNPPR